MLVDLIEARPLSGHRVYLRFEDGLEGEIDLGPFLPSEGVFAPLQDPRRFAEFRLDPELGTICWSHGADLAPETLYAWLVESPPSRPRDGATTGGNG